MRADPRIGLGYDIHRIRPCDRPDAGLMVAGVRVPCPFEVVAHSDGDVLLHALCDALLGAFGLGDLGEHFPDSDPAHRGRDSTWFVQRVLAMPALAGWRLRSLDSNLIVQEPRLGPHKPAMRRRLAELTGLEADRVGIKARTNEHCDAVGRIEAIQAHCAILLTPA